MRSFRTFSVVTMLVAVAAGCSLVNSFDDVKPIHETTYTSGPKVDEPIPDASIDSAEADVADTSAPLVDHSVLVVAGDVDRPDAGEIQDPVLTVLDTSNGHEIGTREALYIAGIGYEAGRELWYLFEAPKYFIPSPTDVVHLHIRTLDAKSGAWTELSNTVVPTLYFYDAIAITNQRVTFVAYGADGGGLPRMITLDTSNPGSPQQIDDRILPALPVGLVATPGSGGPGGQVTAINAGSASADSGVTECEAGVCLAKMHRFLIPNSGPPSDLGTFYFGQMSSTGFVSSGSVVCGGGPDEMFILPKAGVGPHTLHLIDYQSPAATDRLSFDFTMNPNAQLLRRAAVDNTRRIVFLTEANTDTNLYAIPLDSAGSGIVKASLRHSGQSLYYDTASQTAFAPFNQGDGHTFSAFKVVGGGSAPIELKERLAAPDGDWTPPADLRPILLGIHQPKGFNCP